MKPNLADRTCELLKWVCNYRKLHNKTTREQLRQYSLLLLSLLNVSKAMWLMFTHLWGGGGQSDFATTDWLKHSLNNPALHPTLTSSAVYKVIIDNIHTWTKHRRTLFSLLHQISPVLCFLQILSDTLCNSIIMIRLYYNNKTICNNIINNNSYTQVSCQKQFSMQNKV